MQNENRYDVAVVGAGILGLAHAYHLAKAGHKVIVFERGVKATGASVRNFGMIWPIGQAPGQNREIAIRSRQIWHEVLTAAGIWFKECGSLHLAYEQDELDAMCEFVCNSKQYEYKCEIVEPSSVAEKSPHVKQQGLLGAMWSPEEMCVFPRQVVSELPAYLETLGVTFTFSTAVTQVETGRLVARGKEYQADHVLLCTGDDFETLFPSHFAESGLTRSKLQMMRAKPKSANFNLGTHICAGLTLGHYSNFKICDKLPALLDRFKNEFPEHEKWGIHLLVSQHEDGGLTIGDSHEYGLSVTPFTRQEIDQLILDYLARFLPVEELEIQERWYGVYAKHPSKSFIIDKLQQGVSVVTGVGGAGMTLSFGLAEYALNHLAIKR